MGVEGRDNCTCRTSQIKSNFIQAGWPSSRYSPLNHGVFQNITSIAKKLIHTLPYIRRTFIKFDNLSFQVTNPILEHSCHHLTCLTVQVGQNVFLLIVKYSMVQSNIHEISQHPAIYVTGIRRAEILMSVSKQYFTLHVLTISQPPHKL